MSRHIDWLKDGPLMTKNLGYLYIRDTCKTSLYEEAKYFVGLCGSNELILWAHISTLRMNPSD